MSMVKTGSSWKLPENVEYSILTTDGEKLFSIRYADTQIRMAAYRDPTKVQRIGKQSLYEEPEEVLDRYLEKGFDIVGEMEGRSDDFLWVRARAIDADTINENGDYFPWDEFIKEREITSSKDGKKVQAFKTFEGCKVYANHENNDVEQAKGEVVFAELDPDNKCIWTTFFVDAQAWPQMARGIREGYLSDVSMGCSVEWSTCSICDNKATSEKEWCLAKGTSITMSDGSLRSIEDIVVGDEVMTHLGMTRRVLETFERQVDEEIVSFYSSIQSAPLLVTKNHPIWAGRQDGFRCDKDARRWCRPGELDLCALKSRETGSSCDGDHKPRDFEFVPAGELRKGDLIESPVWEASKSKDDIPLSVARIIGYYAAEGHLERKDRLVGFSLSMAEKNTVAADILQACDDVRPHLTSEYDPKTYENRGGDSNGLSICWTNPDLASFLRQVVGCGAKCKRISREVIDALSDDGIRVLLGAVIDGDGYQSSGAKRGDIRVDLASKDLISQLVLLARKVGIRANMFSTTQQGGPTNRDERLDIHCMKITKGDADQLVEFSRRVFDPDAKQHHQSIWTERGIASHIREMSNVYYVGPVYNLRVESENSYVANGISVHNCDHLKDHKGKKWSGKVDSGSKKGQKIDNELVYEVNHDIKFIELSVVSDGAFHESVIQAVISADEVIEHANKIKKGATSLNNLVSEALDKTMSEMPSVFEIERYEALKESAKVADRLADLAYQMIRTSQAPIPPPPANMPQAPPVSGQNVLDVLYDVLNKLEAAIVFLLSWKDNIDLTHVKNLSDAMAKIQQQMSDMIEDGIGHVTSPTAQLQPGAAPQQPGQAPAGGAPAPEYGPAGDVGQMMGPQSFAAQQAAAMGGEPLQTSALPNPTTIPGGVSAGSRGEITVAERLNEMSRILTAAIGPAPIPDRFRTNITEGGGNTIMSTISELTANNLMRKQAARMKHDTHFTSDDERFDVTVSSTGDIVASIDGRAAKWNALSMMTQDDIEDIKQDRLHIVGQKLLGKFMSEAESGKIVMAASGTPISKDDTQREHFLEEKRVGTPDEVREHTLEDKREGTPDEVREHTLEAKRTGTPDEVREHTLEDASAKVLGRRGFDDRVHEHKLEDERTDTPDEVREHTLETRRSSASADRVVSATISALAHAVRDASASPTEVIEASKMMMARSDEFLEQVNASSEADKYRRRTAQRERIEFDLVESSPTSVEQALIDRFADMMVEDPAIVPSDITEVLSQIASMSQENMKQVVGQRARELSGKLGVRAEASQSRSDVIRGALGAIVANEGGGDLTKDSVKAAITAFARTAIATKATPDVLFGEISRMEDGIAVSLVELARSPESIQTRVAKRESAAFWQRLSMRDESDPVEVRSSIIGNLADVAEEAGVSSVAIWRSAKRLSEGSPAAHGLVEHGIASMSKNAISMRDSEEITKEINLEAEELGGVDTNSEQFHDSLRQYVIAFLKDHSYHVDPETFQFTELDVSEDGHIRAMIRSCITKHVSEESGANTFATAPEPERSVPDEVVDMAPNEALKVGMEVGMSPQQDAMFSPMALAKRKQRREAMLRGAQAGGAAPPAAANPMMVDPATTPNAMGPDSPGLSSLMGASGPGGLEGDDSDLDKAGAPGDIKPLGTVCPACGAIDTEIAGGRGECKSCGTRYEVRISIENIVTPDDEKNTESPAELEGPEGLGAATAPPEAGPMMGGGGGMPPAGGAAGAGGAGAAGGGMMPPMMASIRWYTSPKTFVRMAALKQEGFTDEQIPGPKPAGSVCVLCGNLNVRRANSKYGCEACGTIGQIKVSKSRRHEDRLLNSVKVILPDA